MISSFEVPQFGIYSLPPEKRAFLFSYTKSYLLAWWRCPVRRFPLRFWGSFSHKSNPLEVLLLTWLWFLSLRLVGAYGDPVVPGEVVLISLGLWPLWPRNWMIMDVIYFILVLYWSTFFSDQRRQKTKRLELFLNKTFAVLCPYLLCCGHDLLGDLKFQLPLTSFPYHSLFLFLL